MATKTINLDTPTVAKAEMSEPKVQLGGAWIDNHSWQPESLPSPSVVEPEPTPGSLAWLEQGLDELYVSLGGEG